MFKLISVTQRYLPEEETQEFSLYFMNYQSGNNLPYSFRLKAYTTLYRLELEFITSQELVDGVAESTHVPKRSWFISQHEFEMLEAGCPNKIPKFVLKNTPDVLSILEDTLCFTYIRDNSYDGNCMLNHAEFNIDKSKFKNLLDVLIIQGDSVETFNVTCNFKYYISQQAFYYDWLSPPSAFKGSSTFRGFDIDYNGNGSLRFLENFQLIAVPTGYSAQELVKRFRIPANFTLLQLQIN